MADRTYRWLLVSLAVIGFSADQASKYGVFRWLYKDGHFADKSGTGNSFEVVPGWFELIAQFDKEAPLCDCGFSALQTVSAPVMPRVNHGALFGIGQNHKGLANGIFAAVSVALHVPFRLPLDDLVRLAGGLADPAPLVRAARTAVTPLHRALLPAIRQPQWRDDLSEEYLVFHLPPGEPLQPALLLDSRADLLAGLVRLEEGPLSPEEIAEALRLHLGYSPADLFVHPDGVSLV